MFGLIAFAEYPFAQLPNSGPVTIVASVTETLSATDSYIGLDNHGYITESLTTSDAYSAGIVYSKSITESVSASDIYQSPAIEVANLFGFTAFAEAPFAGLTPVPSRNTYANLIESLTATDSISALVQYGVLVSESVTATDNVEQTPSNIEQVVESVTALDSVSTLASFAVTLTESVAALDSVDSLAYLLAALTESAVATDVYTYLSDISADLTETVTATDEYTPAGSTYNVSLSGDVSAQDVYIGGGSTSVDILEVVYANGTFTSRFLWEVIDDTQAANWGSISTIQTPAWSIINNNQTSTWTPITTS